MQTRTSKGNIFGLAWHYIVLAICLWKDQLCLSINSEESVNLVWIVLNYMYFIMSLWLIAAAQLGLQWNLFVMCCLTPIKYFCSIETFYITISKSKQYKERYNF